MRIIITESQTKKVLTESIAEEMGNTLKSGYESIKNTITKAAEQIGMNLQFMLTWGAGISGFMGPIEDFVKGRFPELNDMELSLILTGIIATYYFENKKATKKIYEKIQKEGLGYVFEKVLKKSDKFLSVFGKFIESLTPTIHTVMNMMSYTFIIPLLPMIYQTVQSGMIENVNFDELTKMLMGFGGLTISSLLVKNILLKISRRFKG